MCYFCKNIIKKELSRNKWHRGKKCRDARNEYSTYFINKFGKKNTCFKRCTKNCKYRRYFKTWHIYHQNNKIERGFWKCMECS